jgi:type VI secretion system protein ImpF
MVRLRIEGLLRVEPAPDPIVFDTLVDAATAEIVVKASGGIPERAADHV